MRRTKFAGSLIILEVTRSLIVKQLRWFGRRARFHPCASVKYDGSGFLFEQDTWEPRSLFLRDIPDVVRAYELLESSYPGMSANVIALVHYKSDEVMHYVGNGNEIEVENVVATEYHHDCENETLLRGARRDGQANVSLPCTECPTETVSVVESYDASAVRHA